MPRVARNGSKICDAGTNNRERFERDIDRTNELLRSRGTQS